MEKNEVRKVGEAVVFVGMPAVFDNVLREGLSDRCLYNLQSPLVRYFNHTGIFKEDYYQIKLQFIFPFSPSLQ